MAQNLITSVRTEIDRFQKEIKRRTSELASLKDELTRHQRVYQLLGGKDRRARRPRRGRRRVTKTAPVDWNSVLQKLPSPFVIGDLAKAADAKKKSPVYLRQIAVRWAKQGKTKRIARGNYQKVELRKSHATAGPQRKK